MQVFVSHKHLNKTSIYNKRIFEDIRVFGSTLGHLKHGAAFALPGVGIFVNPKDVANIDLLRHEFGHILQAKIFGYKFFYSTIVPASIKSANKANNDPGFIHQHTWTEWTANWIAYNYFNSPVDWNTKKYPLTTPQNSQAEVFAFMSKSKFNSVALLKQLQFIKMTAAKRD